MPVHAFGYNWTASNAEAGKKLRSFITQLLEFYRDNKGRRNGVCKKVILVTHSMGGLVARAACLDASCEALVLGVVHGVQPVDGSPAAYWRIKAGFERGGFWNVPGRITAHVLGTNGHEVTALLGNMPGGLELLPTKNYKDSQGRKDWLRYRWSGVYSVTMGQNEFVSLPKENPYAEIYRESNAHAPGYMINPRLLNPSVKTEDGAKSEWKKYVTRITEVEQFHDQLGHYKHPNTYAFYGTKAGPTAETVEFECSANVVDLSKQTELPKAWADYEREGYERKFTHRYKANDGTESLLYVHARLQMPSGQGDTTVPSSSAQGLGPLGNAQANVKTVQARPGLEHEPAYNDIAIQNYVFYALCDIVMNYIDETTHHHFREEAKKLELAPSPASGRDARRRTLRRPTSQSNRWASVRWASTGCPGARGRAS
jgi:hypothetical protein